MTIREHTLDLIMAIVLPPGCLSMKNVMDKLNPFTTGCVFKNVLQGPGNTPMLFTKLCPIIKNHKIRLSVSFLVPFESSFKELFFGHKKSFIHPYLPCAFSR